MPATEPRCTTSKEELIDETKMTAVTVNRVKGSASDGEWLRRDLGFWDKNARGLSLLHMLEAGPKKEGRELCRGCLMPQLHAYCTPL